MHLLLPTLLLLQYLSSSSIAQSPQHSDTLAEISTPDPPSPQPQRYLLPHHLNIHLPSTSFFKKLDLRNAAERIPFLQSLRKRQTTANTNAAADGTADTGAAAQQAAVPAAPVAGVGGGAGPAPAQPAANAAAATTAAAAAAFTPPSAAPSVQSGSIGLGTLTGQIGVVKTNQASAGTRDVERVGIGWSVGAVAGIWGLGMGVGGVIFGWGGL